MPASLDLSAPLGLSRGFRACLLLIATIGLSATAFGQTPYAYTNQWVTLPAAGLNQPTGVALDASGNIFVADSANHAVKEILAAGGYTTVNTLASAFTFNTPADVALDRSGNVYVADSGANAVYRIAKAGGYVNVRTLGSGFKAPTSVAVDSSGNVFVADSGNNAVKEIEAPTYRTVVTLGGGYSFGEVYGVALDGSGNLFVADSVGNAVDELTAGSSYTSVTPLGGGFAFQDPIAVAVDADGNLYVNQNDFPINLLELPAAETYGTVLELPSPSSENPVGLATDANGDLFVGDVYNNQVDEVLASTFNLGTFNVGSPSPVTTLTFVFCCGSGTIDAPQVLTLGNANGDFTDVGTGTCDTNGTSHTYNSGDSCTVDIQFKPTHPGQRWGAVELTSGGTNIGENYVVGTGEGPQSFFQSANSGPFPLPPTGLEPNGVAVDANENVFVLDENADALDEFTAASGYTTVNTLDSGFEGPTALAMDAAGNFFVGDSGYHEVIWFDHNGNFFQTIGGFSDPEEGSVPVAYPIGLAVDRDGNLFIADPFLGYVAELYWWDYYDNGVVLASDWGEGVPISGPAAVALDASGNLFVSDYFGDAVVELPASSGYTTENPLGGSYAFDDPYALALDPSGNLYVSEASGNLDELPAAGGYSTVNTVGSGGYAAITIDAAGNIFLGDVKNGTVDAIDVASPPALSFAATAVGSTSSDSPQTVTVGNNGNLPLTLRSVQYPADFPEASSGCTSGERLAPGSSCTLNIEFMPLETSVMGASTALQEALLLVDNSLNSNPSARQSLELSGTATSDYPFGALTKAADMVTGSTTVEQADSLLVTGWAADPTDGAPVARVSVEIDGSPVGNATLGIAEASIAKTYGAGYLSSGWTYTVPGGSLSAGTHTVSAVIYDNGGRTRQLATRTITVTAAPAPPFGAVDTVADAITKSTPIGASDGLLVTGWAGDLVDGAPVAGGVSIFIDCTTNIADCVPAGPATLGIADPAVVTATGDSSLANSGWSFSYSGLSIGTHTITVEAYDSGGRSATLGTRTVTVQANAPPFGAMSAPIDGVTDSATLGSGDSLVFTGWAADVHDGAPVSSVTIYIDCTTAYTSCTPAGTATLGINRASIGKTYGSRYLQSGWTYTYSPGLSAGTHTVTAVYGDSLTLTTQLTRSFNVVP